MILPVDSNIVACNVNRETANVRERDLPVRSFGKFQSTYK